MSGDFWWWNRLFLTALVIAIGSGVGGAVLEALGRQRALRWVAVVAGVAFPAVLISMLGMIWSM